MTQYLSESKNSTNVRAASVAMDFPGKSTPPSMTPETRRPPMNRTEELSNAYRRGDHEQRLYLFLSHPALRRTFMQIDLSEHQAGAAVQPHPSRLVLWLRNFLIPWI